MLRFMLLCMNLLAQASSYFAPPTTKPPEPGCDGYQCGPKHDECKPGWGFDHHHSCCACPAGTHKLLCGKSLGCDDCLSGFFSGLGSAKCSPCLPGSYGPMKGLSECIECAAGTYSSHSNQTQCTDCESGTFYPFKGGNSSSFCTSCSPGSYSGPGQPRCDYCPAGTYNPGFRSKSALACMDCKAGTFSSVGASKCTECLPGHYSHDQAEACIMCEAGTFNPNYNQSSCADCPPGYCSTAGASVRCDACPAGVYCPDNKTIAGIPCPKGSYCPSGSAAPKPCAEGSYCPPSSNAPVPCPAGSYGSQYGLDSGEQCTKCPQGMQSFAGATSCSPEICIPAPFNFATFNCYSTLSKIGMIVSYILSLISAILFPFKLRTIYLNRKALLEAAGLQPTLKHMIFHKSAIARAVSLQPLVSRQMHD
jgi:hypothetical protein